LLPTHHYVQERLMAAEKPDSAPRKTEAKPPPKAGWSARRRDLVASAAAALVLTGGIITTVVLTNSESPNGRPLGVQSSSAASESPGSSAGPADSPSPGPSARATPLAPSAPVAIDKPAQISPGLSAAITKFEAVEGKALTPGEVSAPCVRITVTIRNATSSAVPLNTAVVTAYYGADATPALELTSPGGTPFPAKLEAGNTATAIYLFSIPVDQRDRVRIEVDYSVEVSPLVFEGAVPR
jgi:hypothetical protein